MVREIPVRTKPYKHQMDAYAFAKGLTSCALLMEQGTGKTLSAIGVAGHHYETGSIKSLLVIAPLSVLSEWERQLEEHADFPYTLATIGGKLLRKRALLNVKRKVHGLDILLVNYDSLKSLAKDLIKYRFGMVILDESQKIKNPRAIRSKFCHELGAQVKYKLILTGTPVTQTPLDFFSQFKFLDYRIFGKSYPQFRVRYAIMGGYMNKQVIDYQNLDELVSKVHAISFRVTKAEALDLPPTTDQVLNVTLEPKAEAMYEKMKKEALLELEQGDLLAPIVLTKMLRLQQITGGFIPVEDEEGVKKMVQVSKAKLDVLEDLLEDILVGDKKVVIFARFIPEITAISKMLRKNKIIHSIFTGKTDASDRKLGLSKFQSSKKCKVFLAQIATGGVGITLTAADTMIFYSLDFSLANYEQAKARIHRIGQESKVTYIHLLVKKTLDSYTYQALRAKRNLAKLVVDDWKTLLKEGK